MRGGRLGRRHQHEEQTLHDTTSDENENGGHVRCTNINADDEASHQHDVHV